MTNKKAFRAEQGLDAANSNVINVADPRLGELYDGVNQNYFIQENTVQPHSSTRTYKEGFIVEYDKRLYKANTNLPAKAFTASDWTLLRVDSPWRTVTPSVGSKNTIGGDFVHIDTRISSFDVTLPSAPVSGDMVVFNDLYSQAHLRPIGLRSETYTIDGVNRATGNPAYLMCLPGATWYLYFTGTQWNLSIRSKVKDSLVYASQTTQLTPYQLAPNEIVWLISDAKVWTRLPAFANHGDVIRIVDVRREVQNNYGYTEIHPDAVGVQKIRAFDNLVDTFTTNLSGEAAFVYDAVNNVWEGYAGDLRPREIPTYSNMQAEPFQLIHCYHTVQNNITVTLPMLSSTGDWVEIQDYYSTPNSSVTINLHPTTISNGVRIVGDVSASIKRKYSQLEHNFASLPRNTSITIPTGDHGITIRLYYNSSGNEWVIAYLTNRVEHVDELNRDRPGVAPLATQAQANKQQYAPDSLSQNPDKDRIITPETLDGRRSTETLAGLARIANNSELQVVTEGVHRDDVIVTPRKLNSRQATETIRGLAEIATQTETRSLTNDTHVITPMKFHAALAEETLSGVAKLTLAAGVARSSRAGNGTVDSIFDKNNHATIVTPKTLDLYRATENQPGTLWVATQAEANVDTESSPVDNAVITPAKLAARTSTELRRGISRIATQAETNAVSGTGESWTSVIVTPQKLNSRTATETRVGLAEIATQAELNAGAVDTHIISPLKFKNWMQLSHITTQTTDGLSHTGDLWAGVNFTIAPATETQRGTLEVATQVEADVMGASASDAHIITPKKLDARRATSALYGIARRATDAEIDSASTDLGNLAGDPVIVTPANLTRWTRTSTNSRATQSRYGVNRTAVTSEAWVGNSTAGSTQAIDSYLHDGIAVSPRGLNFALVNYLPLLGTAANSNQLGGFTASQYARRDINQDINAVYTFKNSLATIEGSSTATLRINGATKVWNIGKNDSASTSFSIREDASNRLLIAAGGNTSINQKLTVGDSQTSNDTAFLISKGAISEANATANVDATYATYSSPATGTLRQKYLGINNVAKAAEKLVTSRTITFTGDLSGSFTFDGSGNVSTNIQVVDGSHFHSAANITSGTLNVERTPQASTTVRGTVQLTDDTRLTSTTLALSANGGRLLQEQIDSFVPDGGVGTSVKYSEYIQIGSVRMSANDQGVLEFTYGHPLV